MIRVLFTAMLLGFLCENAEAQPKSCGPRDKMVANLLRGYGETVVGRGIIQAGSMMEIFASPTGSWTMLITHPAGLTCAVAAGEDWEIHIMEPPGQDS